MVVPWLKGFLNWSQAPTTWLLLSLNVLFFVLTLPLNLKTSSQGLNQEDQLYLSGVLYFQYLNRDLVDPVITKDSKHESKVTPSIDLPAKDKIYLLGAQGLKDYQFLQKIDSLHFQGDQIQIAEWKNKVSEMHSSIVAKNSFGYGLHRMNQGSLSWVTYQFMHAGWVHLFSNMFMLMIFGAAVELLAGSIALLVLYLIGGFVAGYAFLNFSDSTWMPMIGASGAVTSVMAGYLVLEAKRRIPYFYFLSPFPGHYGFIYLPTLLLIPLLFLPDLVSYLSAPAEIGSSVAYSAHLGGALGGLVIALMIKLFLRPTIVLLGRGKPSA